MMNDGIFDIENKNSEYEVESKIGGIIGVTKGTLQTFKDKLQSILIKEYGGDCEKTFYALKDEITSYINGIEECCILPTTDLLFQNPASSYRFVMYWITDHFNVANYREIMNKYNIYDNDAEAQQLLDLWNFAGRLVSESHRMLLIADHQLTELYRS